MTDISNHPTLAAFVELDDKQILEMCVAADPPTRGIVGKAVMGHTGIAPMEFIKMKPPEKVAHIVDALTKHGFRQAAGKAPAAAATKAAAPAATKAAGAAPKATAAPKGEGGGTDAALHAKVDALTAKVDQLTSALATTLKLVSDAHFLTRVLVQSNSEVYAMTEDPELQSILYGNPAVEGNPVGS